MTPKIFMTLARSNVAVYYGAANIVARNDRKYTPRR